MLDPRLRLLVIIIVYFAAAGPHAAAQPEQPDGAQAQSRLSWSTYFGGANFNTINDVKLLSSGKCIVVGTSDGPGGIATPGAMKATAEGLDAFVACFNPDGTQEWGTFFGGWRNDRTSALAIDGQDNIIVVGRAESDSMGTQGTHQPYNAGFPDAFILKLAPDGTRIWSTYFGGPGIDGAYAVAIGPNDEIVMAGETFSEEGIATSGAFQTQLGGRNDGFVAVFDSAGSLLRATYFGGPLNDDATAVACDASGVLFLAGTTSSEQGIASALAHKQSLGGPRDAYLAAFSPAGAQLWSSYFGGDRNEFASALALSNGSIVLTGQSDSNEGVATPGTFQEYNRMHGLPFVAKFTTSGQQVWGTYVGGYSMGWGKALACTGNTIALAGYTRDTSRLSTPDGYQAANGGAVDAFLVAFDTDGQRAYGTYFGGDMGEYTEGVAMDESGAVYLAGQTQSTGLATPGAHQMTHNGITSGFLLRFSLDNSLETFAGADTLICAGTMVQLLAQTTGGTPPYTYNWSPSATVRNPADANPMASPVATTTYVVQVTDANNNTATDSVTVSVDAMPDLAILGPQQVGYRDVVPYSVQAVSGATYRWTANGGSILDGQGTSRVTVLWETSGTGDIAVHLTTTAGCTYTGGPLLVDVTESVALLPTISVFGDTLESSPGIGYQWYYNNAEMPGESTRRIIAGDAGEYFVVVHFSGRLPAASEPVTMPWCYPAAAFSVPVITAAPGERIDIPISLESTSCLESFDIYDLSFEVHVSPDILHLESSPGVTEIEVASGETVVRLAGLSGSATEIASLRGTAMLGSTDTAVIRIANIEWKNADGRTVNATSRNGLFVLDVCREGGPRLFDGSQVFSLAQNHPNPFNSTTTIAYTTIEKSHTSLTVYDLYGRRVAVLAEGIHEPGSYTVRFHADALPSGTYISILRSGGLQMHRIMRHLK